MRKFLSLVIGILLFQCASAQKYYADSLRTAFETARDNKTRSFALYRLSLYYSFLYIDSSSYYAEKLIKVSDSTNYLPGKILGMVNKAEALDRIASYPAALEVSLTALELTKNLSSERETVSGLVQAIIGHLYSITGNFQEALLHIDQSRGHFIKSNEFPEFLYLTYFASGYAMLQIGNKDSALFYVKKGKPFLPALKKLGNPSPWLITGNVYMQGFENIDSAEHYFKEGLHFSDEVNALFSSAVFYQAIGGVLLNRGRKDSCIYYVKKSLALSQQYHYKLFELNASGFLNFLYDGVNIDSAYKYLKLGSELNDEIQSSDKVRLFQKAAADAEKKETEIEAAKTRYETQLKLYSLIGALTIFVVIAFMFWRNNRHRKKANVLLSAQKVQLEKTLAELKSTQSQLVHAEKMASLGQLTAGIAHEIQNPLNFVNNFSELNADMLSELREEIENGNLVQAKQMADELIENEQKIILHGKRAGSIVNGMLQHARPSPGHKEFSDINSLVEENLRLAFQAFKAKNPNFDALTQTSLDPGIGKIQIVPQEIGQVLSNLFNNAFYAVFEKAKNLGADFQALVTVSTKKKSQYVEITVSDNGTGITDAIQEKIFQPFFTTKPTGQGTGLGLSLSYDIITKGHKGELAVASSPNSLTTFTVKLPI